MLNGRLYRAAFAPLLLAIVVAGFSLRDEPRPLTSTLAPDVFDGVRATRVLDQMAARFPHRRAGSAGDDALARFIAGQLAAAPPPELGAAASSPHSTFAVSAHRFDARTIDGTRTLTTVLARRPGINNRQIVIVAHRDAAAAGSRAELSGTAALLELGRVLAQRVTNRSITLVSTSGGSGGDAGAADVISQAGAPVDAVIVIGDVAGAEARRPFVLSWSNGSQLAPPLLTRTAQDAITAEVGAAPGNPSLASQFVHLALPFTVDEQGVFNEAGIPAVTVQVSGERGPSPSDSVSPDRMQNFGRSVLQTLNALDTGPDMPAPSAVLRFQRQLIPIWAVRLIVAMLILPALLATIDGFARARRRREHVAAWVRWTLACAVPFFVAALFALALGTTGLLDAPGAPIRPGAMPVRSGAAAALVGALAVFGLCWAAWRPAVRRLGVRGAPSSAGAGAALLLVLELLTVAAWVVNPFVAALMVPALHLWLAVAAPDLRPRRALALALVAGGVILPLGAVAILAHDLGAGPLQVAWLAMLALAGGHVGVIGAVFWSVALGCVVAAAMIALQGRAPVVPAPPERQVTIRGPLTYAGPGSLGGTESALRR